jgi:Protein of unknown function (DUF2892)
MFYFKRNLPRWERALRTAAGLGALTLAAALGLQTSGAVFWSLIAVAVALVLTGLVGFCPACAMVGRRTIGKSS